MSFKKASLYIYKTGQDGDGSFLDPVSILEDYATLSYQHGAYFAGAFQLTVNKSTRHASDLSKGRMIRIGEDDTHAVMIDTIKEVMDPKGNVIMTVSGSELWALLKRREDLPPAGEAYYTTAYTDPVETGIKGLINFNAGSTAVASRVISSLNVVATAGGGDAYKFSERYSNLYEAVSKAFLATGSSIRVTLNHTTKKWDLDWIAGTDRTATVIISSKFNTAREATLTTSDIAYRNVVIAAGQGEGADRNIRTVYSGTEPTDLDRREIFRDMRDLSLNTSIDQRAAQVLAEQSYTRTIAVSPLIYSRVVYDVNYFVGDTVKFDELGVAQNVWITSATEEWSNKAYDLNLGIEKAPASVTGQVGALIASNTQAMATIDPVWPSSNDVTLASDSPESLTTVHAVRGYVDSLVVPSQESLVLALTYDDAPDYPDGLAVIAQSLWAATTGWSGSTGATTVSVSGGKLVATFDGTGGLGTSFGVTGSTSYSNKHLAVKVVSQTLITNIKHLESSLMVNVDYVLLDPYTAIVADYGNGDDAFISINHGVAVANVVFVDYFYLGDGSYSSLLIDASKSKLLVTAQGVVSTYGKSGRAIICTTDSYLKVIDSRFDRVDGQTLNIATTINTTRVSGNIQIIVNVTKSGVGNNWYLYLSASTGRLSLGGALGYESAWSPSIGVDTHITATVSAAGQSVITANGAVIYDSGVGGFSFGTSPIGELWIGQDAGSPSNFAGAISPILIDTGNVWSDAGKRWLYQNKILPVIDATTAIRKYEPITGLPIASVAGSITPTGSMFHVTGTAAITGIVFSGIRQITIIPDGVFTWTTAGNIALAGTSVVSKALFFTYDASTLKWYPSYT